MGVNITLEFAKRYKDLLSAMVLISGTVLPPQDHMFHSDIVKRVFPYIDWLTQSFPETFKKIWQTSYLNPIARQVIFKGGFNTQTVPEEFIQVYMKRIGKLPQDILIHLMKEMREHKILNDLENIKTPTLIIGGDQDQIIPNHLQLILKDCLPTSELYIVKDGSHVPQVDFPETINQRIQLFFSKYLL